MYMEPDPAFWADTLLLPVVTAQTVGRADHPQMPLILESSVP